jgi:hypothetical protein
MRWFPIAALAAALAGPAVAADVSTTAGYMISIGGINVATASVKFTDSAQHYDLLLTADVTGLGGVVASGTARAEATGSSAAATLASETFALKTHANGEDFKIDAKFAHGNATAFVVTPPLVNNVDRVPIERSHLLGTGDMLSAFVFKAPLDASVCQRQFHIFTGVERFNLGLSFLKQDKATSLRTAYQGPVIQCRMKYTPVSGHFTTSDMTNYLAKSDDLYIWYAPLKDTGYVLPYRVLITTTAGDLSMVLTSLKG